MAALINTWWPLSPWSENAFWLVANDILPFYLLLIFVNKLPINKQWLLNDYVKRVFNVIHICEC